MVHNITSTKNEKFKTFKSLKNKKERDNMGLYTVEGIKSCCDAIKANCSIYAILVTEEFYNGENFDFDNYEVFVFLNDIFANLSDTKTPQGIIAVINKENKSIIPDINKLYIYCDHIQDPGNMGTIIRTADAAGFAGVLISPDSVDIYNPKTVRSSMGSFFHIPIETEVSLQKIKEYQQKGFSLVCGVLSDKTINYLDCDFTKPTIITVGNEANGISKEVLEISDIDVKIPINGEAESLNAAIASAILMYEAIRQRRG